MNALTQTHVPPNALEALRRKAAMESAEVWKPTDGDVLEAVIAGWRQALGPFGTQWQMLTQTLDGRRMAVWLNPWLQSELKRLQAARGDLVSVAYHGKARSKRGTEFNSYSLTVLKAEDV